MSEHSLPRTLTRPCSQAAFRAVHPLVASCLQIAKPDRATFGPTNVLPFGDPAKRWAAIPLDGNPTFPSSGHNVSDILRRCSRVDPATVATSSGLPAKVVGGMMGGDG